MAEWNGKLITDMSSSHIENTINLLHKQAVKACKKAHGSDWRLYAQPIYFDLKQELEKRSLDF